MPIPNLSANHRRALIVLAGSENGCTESLLLAHGFTAEHTDDLLRAGLATAKGERMIAGARTVEVIRVSITDAGRQRLADAS